MKVSGETPTGSRFNGYDPSNGKLSNRTFSNSPKNAPASNLFPHEEKRSGEARVTYLTEYELMNVKVSGDVDPAAARQPSLQHERLMALKSSTGPGSVPATKNLDAVPGHLGELGPDQRLIPVSEDEMSAVSLGKYFIKSYNKN